MAPPPYNLPLLRIPLEEPFDFFTSDAHFQIPSMDTYPLGLSSLGVMPTGQRREPRENFILEGSEQDPRQRRFHHSRDDKYPSSHFSHTLPRGHLSTRHFVLIPLTAKVTSTNDVQVILPRSRHLLLDRRCPVWHPPVPFLLNWTSTELAQCSRIDLHLQVP